MKHQNLFNILTELFDTTPLETDMLEIINAYEKDKEEIKFKELEENCSYCGKSLGKKYAINSIFVMPTICKCKRWWCNLAKRFGIFKLKWQ